MPTPRKNPRKPAPPDSTSEIDDPRAWLLRLPKAELHLHLEGSTSPHTLVELSQRHDASPLTLADAQRLYTYANFQGFMEAYKAMSSRLRTPEDYELVTSRMIASLAQQGVVHAEVYISFGILHFLHKVEVEPYVQAIERARIAGEKQYGISLLWLIDAVRHFGLQEAARVFRKAAELRPHYPSIVGIGIGGDEARGPASIFGDLYAEARDAGLRLTAHAGETGGPTAGPASIWAAINIGAERIGHALAAQHDPQLLEVLAEKQIPIEINVTSNLRTGCCPSLDAHPLRTYFDSGLMVTLNSDDPPMFGAHLLDEYLLAHTDPNFNFTLEQLRELAANSVEASFLQPTRKLALLAQIEQYG